MNLRLASVLSVGILSILGSVSALAQSAKIDTVQEYNQELPLWGTAWGAGKGAVTGRYYPSFYTGFTIRSEYPERIHVRLARGNQTRLSVILDDKTISDYAFDLEKRYEVYKKITAANVIDVTPQGASFIPQMDYFSQIIESDNYGLLAFTKSANDGAQSDKNIYAKNLEILKKLNPNRIFSLKINLKTEFLKWKSYLQNILNTTDSSIADNSNQAVVALNSLLWGRVNVVEAPNTDIQKKLRASLALINGNEAEFLAAARDLFIAVTGSKYNFKVLDASGDWAPAIQCKDLNQCFLSYPEFTAIYPTGSVVGKSSDQFGNKIATFASTGLWRFVSSGESRSVDNIRSEGYYGWVPKMNYEENGNGFHNPAVLNPASRSAQEDLGIRSDQNKLWAVMRGGVSHGCSRLPAGGAWEMRHTFPVENSKMTEIYFFNNNYQDFDLYDVDGDGEVEVMGVEYLISYALAGDSDLARREGKDLEINKDSKVDFYKKLYGAKNVFKEAAGGKFVFTNPGISMPSYLDFKKKSVSTRKTLSGEFKLYEQTYEKDKIQFYTTGGGDVNRKIVKLLGRIRGCAPAANKEQCGEASFDNEAKTIVKGMVK